MNANNKENMGAPQKVPDTFRRHPGPGYIYLMQSQSNPNEIKIGLSNDPPRRAKDLYRTNIPLPLLIRATWWVTHMEFTEKNIHTLFAENRIVNRREFFNVAHPLSSLYPQVFLEFAFDITISIESFLETTIAMIDDGLDYLTATFDDFQYSPIQLE